MEASINLEKETWKIIDTYFKTNKDYLTIHHLDSYHNFLNNRIIGIINNSNPLINLKDKIEGTAEYRYKLEIWIGGSEGNQLFIGKPIISSSTNKKQLYPNEARLKNLTYATDIYADILVRYTLRDNAYEDPQITEETYSNIKIGKIPIMLHSQYCVLYNKPEKLLTEMGECPYDQGGYFIINGKEKVIVSQEKGSENNVYINKTSNPLYEYYAEVKSYSEQSFQAPRSTSLKLLNKNGNIVVDIPSFRASIPLFILFRALGINTDKDICNFICVDNNEKLNNMIREVLVPSINDVGPVYNQNEAIYFLEKLTRFKSIYHVFKILEEDFVPHIGSDFTNKAFYLGYIVNKLILVSLGIIKKTDKDSFSNKRIDLSGFLLSGLFRELFGEFRKKCYKTIDEIYNYNKVRYSGNEFLTIVEKNKNKIFDFLIIEKGFTNAMKGSWGVKKNPDKQGIVQDLNRLSNLGTISHLRRTNLPLSRSAKIVDPRRLHGSSWGLICPVDTPDGGNIGLHKNLAIFTKISFSSLGESIIDFLDDYGMVKLGNIVPTELYKYTRIFVNGNWCGAHHDPEYITLLLKLFKRNGLINIFTSIAWNISDKSINIRTDQGRTMRPLYIVKNTDGINNQQLTLDQHILDNIDSMNWYDFIFGGLKRRDGKPRELDIYSSEYISPEVFGLNIDVDLLENLEKTQGIIEYLDAEEENTSMIAMNQMVLTASKVIHTHCELHPSLILGPLALSIPYLDHNQSPRNAFSCAQAKQAVGLYTTNYKNRMDTFANVLYYPQKPLVKTRFSKFIHNDQLPYGINAIVAIASYTGYNQEDSVIINKNAIDRGLFLSSYYRSYDTTETVEGGISSEEICNPIFKTDVKTKTGRNYDKLDETGVIREGTRLNGGDVIVGKVNYIGSGQLIDDSLVIKKTDVGIVDKVFCFDTYGSKTCKVRIKSERAPVLGDKFGSRHGQKGVVGMLFNQEDMPYTKEGIVPDIIINPHAIPSRMTIGQLIECVMGKSASLLGFNVDATPFTPFNIEEMHSILDNCGFDGYGNEILYSGKTGGQLDASIFIGPTYYSRFKHMVKDKVHSRATGPNLSLTKQPAGGRAREGGLRIGEMERDAILAHGCSQFLKESFMERADKFAVYICKYTGLIAPINPDKNIWNSKTENQSVEYAKIIIPYAMKLLLQELNAFGMSLRFLTGTQQRDKIYLSDNIFTMNLSNDEVMMDEFNQLREYIAEQKDDIETKFGFKLNSNAPKSYAHNIKNRAVFITPIDDKQEIIELLNTTHTIDGEPFSDKLDSKKHNWESVMIIYEDPDLKKKLRKKEKGDYITIENQAVIIFKDSKSALEFIDKIDPKGLKLVNDEQIDKVEKLSLASQNKYNNADEISSDFYIGENVEAQFDKSKKWKRAKVIEIPNKKSIIIRFDGYNDEYTVTSQHIRKLPDDPEPYVAPIAKKHEFAPPTKYKKDDPKKMPAIDIAVYDEVEEKGDFEDNFWDEENMDFTGPPPKKEDSPPPKKKTPQPPPPKKEDSPSPKKKTPQPPPPKKVQPDSPVNEPDFHVNEPDSPKYEPLSPPYTPDSPKYEPDFHVNEPDSPEYEPLSPPYTPLEENIKNLSGGNLSNETIDYEKQIGAGINLQIDSSGNDLQIDNLGNDLQIDNFGNDLQIDNFGNDLQIDNLGNDLQIDNLDNDLHNNYQSGLTQESNCLVESSFDSELDKEIDDILENDEHLNFGKMKKDSKIKVIKLDM